MEERSFANPSLSEHRAHLRELFRVFGEATGYPPTFIGAVTRNDPKWPRHFEERDFTHSSYDATVARLSALWPEGTPWPAAVPRQAPAEIPPDVLEKIEKRRSTQSSRPANLPGGADWPDDIPLPGQARKTETVNEVENG